MPRLRPALLFVVLSVLAGPVRGQTAPDAVRGTWRSKLPLFGDGVRFDLLTEQGAEISLTIEPHELDGLTRSDLKTTGKPLRFGWVRDAATLRFEGLGRFLGRPAGTFVLEPNPQFVELLSSIGRGQPSAADLLHLALGGASRESLVALREAGYAGLSIDDLSRLDAYGLDSRFVLSVQELGYRPDIEDLIQLRVRGVQVSTIHELARLKLSGIPVDDLVRFTNHGIDPRYLRGMADAGYPPSEVEALVRLRTHGLDPAEVLAMRAVAGFDLSVDDLLELQAHGIGAKYLAGLAQSGNARLTVDGVRELSVRGVRADDYCAFHRLGYGEVDHVVELTAHGVDPETVEQFVGLGYGKLSVDDLVRLQTHGVEPAFVRQLAEAGYDDLTVDQLVELRIRGVAGAPVHKKAA